MGATLRENPLVRFIGYMVAIYSFGFGATTLWVGDRVTSKPWQALMTIVPGDKWFWGTWFMVCSAIIFYGLRQHQYKVIAVGHFITTLGCISIATFLALGPMFGPGLVTLGYWPWYFGAGMGSLLGAVNWRPVSW